MQYLVLNVDPFGIPLRVHGESPTRGWPIELSSSLKAKLVDWNDRFSDLIASNHLYTPHEINRMKAALNEEGLKLSGVANIELSGKAKVTFLME
jgi:hypothetical protein